jgi:hypothetical protein
MTLPEDSLVGFAARIADGPIGTSADATAEDVFESPEGADEPDLRLAFRDLERVARAYRSLGQAERPAPPALPRRWGHLELCEKLGEGAAAEVFRAHDTRLDHDVALKLFKSTGLTASEKQTVLEEGRRHARVKHGNIATIHDANEHDGRLGISMEYVDGSTLHDLVDRQGAYGAGEAAHVGVELCRAVAAIHRQGLVHGDIKAQNVMREKGGRIVLMDFSTSRPLDASPGAHWAYTEGTPIYMAPEQFEGGPPSPRSDIYALGVLLFYLATGDYPVRARSLEELRDRVRRGERQSLYDLRPDLPTSFVRTVERALARDPKDRFTSAGALGGALSESNVAAAAGESPSGLWAPAPRAEESFRVPPLLRWLAVLAGVVGFFDFLGFMSSTALNVSLGRPSTFADESAVDWLIWGVRCLIPAVAYMALAALAWAIVLGAGRLLAAVGPIGRAVGRLRARATGFVARHRLGGASTLARGLFVVGLLGLAVICWRFSELMEAFTSYLYLVSSRDVDPLRPDQATTHAAYGLSLDLLTLALGYAWLKVFRVWRRDRVRGAAAPLAGAAMVVAAALVLLAVPYRILWHNEFEKVELDGRRAYVLGRHDGQLLVFVPDGAEAQKRVVIGEGDPRLRHLNVMENVFSPAVPSGREVDR